LNQEDKDRIGEFLRGNENADPLEVARRFNVKPRIVYGIRAKLRKQAAEERRDCRDLARRIAAMRELARLIRESGGLKVVLECLDALGEEVEPRDKQ